MFDLGLTLNSSVKFSKVIFKFLNGILITYDFILYFIIYIEILKIFFFIFIYALYIIYAYFSFLSLLNY